MKRILMAIAGVLGLAAAGQPALAADYTPVAATNWTGGYLGATVGALRGEANWFIPGGVATPYASDTGALVGLTAGYNWQVGNWVYGLEGDWSWSNWEAGPMVGCGGGCMTGIDWLATLRGRIGYANDALLVYLTGGAAFAYVDNRFQSGAAAVSGTESGWTLGGGAEVKFNPNWSAKAEYLYVSVSDSRACNAPPCAVPNFSDPSDIHVFRLGINYMLY